MKPLLVSASSWSHSHILEYLLDNFEWKKEDLKSALKVVDNKSICMKILKDYQKKKYSCSLTCCFKWLLIIKIQTIDFSLKAHQCSSRTSSSMDHLPVLSSLSLLSLLKQPPWARTVRVFTTQIVVVPSCIKVALK